MDQSRRRLFGFGAAAAVAAMVPAVAVASEPKDEEVKPLLLEHTCDGGKSRYTPEGVKWSEENGRKYWGCGTRFRWYFGANAMCPNCGYCYLATIDDVKNGFYKRISG